MRTLLIVMLAVTVVIGGFIALWKWRPFPGPPATSTEVVEFTPEKRQALEQLRAEHKFRPHEMAPWYYVGVETPQEEATANAAVHSVIDEILALSDQRLPAKTVAGLIEQGMKKSRSACDRGSRSDAGVHA